MSVVKIFLIALISIASSLIAEAVHNVMTKGAG